jgi:glyoxylase I family protein
VGDAGTRLDVGGSQTITVGGVHHLSFTVRDAERSRDFYTSVLGFQVVTELPKGYFLSNGTAMFGVRTAPDPSQTITNDKFNENRVGMDHFALSLPDRGALEHAAAVLDARGIGHGEITNLEPFGIVVLFFRDPDNIQVELSAPMI